MDELATYRDIISHCPTCRELIPRKSAQGWALEAAKDKATRLGFHLSYLRLRALIPGAFNTPFAPSNEQIWATTETALAQMRKDLRDIHNLTHRDSSTGIIEGTTLHKIWQITSDYV